MSTYVQVTLDFLCYISGIWLGALMNGSLDTLISGLMTHAGGQLEVLKHSLRHVKKYATRRLQIRNISNHKNSSTQVEYAEKKCEEFDAALLKEIQNCIVHHEAITE